MPNALASETSPYLQQHKDNPVDWHPWGPEALELARREDKPILLSIGYSSCHWCHVMAHESFENEEVAELMNRLFIELARATAGALRQKVWLDGRLMAVWKAGQARLDAYLDDHALLLSALLELMQADFRPEDLAWAQQLADAMLERFEDPKRGGFYFTGQDHERLIVRPKTVHDQAIPSGNGTAALG